MAGYAAKIAQLRQVVKLINETAEILEAEWTEATSTPPMKLDGGFEFVSPRMYEAQRTMIGATGSIIQLVEEPYTRLVETVGLYWTSTALLVAAEHRVADMLDGHDREGVHIQELAREAGVSDSRLERILRTLTTENIFREVSESRFANTSTSKSLVGNEGLRSYLLQYGGPAFSAADYLPAYLLEQGREASNKANETAFNIATGSSATYFEWLQQLVPKDTGRYHSLNYDPTRLSREIEDSTPRPEMAIFVNTMRSSATVYGTGPVYDYPWAGLGQATVVDIGGNVGAVCLALASLYPKLKYVIQDTKAGLEQAPFVWEQQNKAAIETKQVKFQVHDFFTEQPVQNAEVYWLRYIMHDWSDDYCVQILSNIAPAMGPKSRLLICDQVMNTSFGSSDMHRAPDPLPANYGTARRVTNHMDMYMLACLNGVERTPSQFKALIEKAGLKLVKIWDCRSTLSIVECCRAE